MCLDDKTLSAYIDGELSEPWKTQVEEHLLHCQSCKHRFEQQKSLGRQIQAARIQDFEFEDQKERVWKYLKSNVVSEEPTRFMKRRLYVRTPALIGVAAAFVCLFAINFFVVQNMKAGQDVTDTPIPVIATAEATAQPEAAGEMVKVSATDSVAVARILDDLSVEEILVLLDKKGYEVDMRLKDIEGVPVTMTEEVVDDPTTPWDESLGELPEESELVTE